MGSNSILNGIRIASPCSASWESMTGDDRARFCSNCDKMVYNISAMTAKEATTLISSHEGKLCVGLYRRSDGTTLTADCPVGARATRRGRLRKLAGLGFVVLAMASNSVAAFGLGPGTPEPLPTGTGSALGDWVDWAMIQLGLRKPRAGFILGEMGTVPATAPTPGLPVAPTTSSSRTSAAPSA